MNHDERMHLARGICARVVAGHPGEVILGGVYGSTARGTDTPWSDLELLFVVRDGSEMEKRELIYRGTAVGYQVVAQHKLQKLLSLPSLEWPFWMGLLSVIKVLYGEQEQVQTWLRLGRSVPAVKFRKTLEASLPGLVVESYGRILSCRERHNTQDIGCAVIEVLFEMRQALCLLNRRWVTHDYYQGLVDTFRFRKLPERYRDLVPALWFAHSIDEIVPLAKELVGNFWQLLADEGIQVTDHHRLENVPL